MTTVTVTSHITAPVEHVFGLFTDIEQAPGRVGGIKKIEMLTPGRFELGSRWRETREVLGRLDSAEMEVTAFERNRTYTITHHKGGVGVETVFTFEPSGDGTKVTLTFSLETSGLPPGLLTPVSWAIAGKVHDVLTHDLVDLKRSVETYVH